VAYTDDINALSPVHAFSFNGNATDRAGALGSTATTIAYTGAALCEGVTNSLLTDGTTDNLELLSSPTFNGVAQTRMAVGGWFSITSIQNPPKHCVMIGDGNNAMKIILGWGNALMFELDFGTILQIFGDIDLEVNRPYHFFMAFEGNGFGNEFRAYLDGVKQLNAEPVARQPNTASLPSRTAGTRFGNASASVVGGVVVTTLAPLNGQYNEWAFFDGASSVLTDTQVREELFEKGALPEVTITNQLGLDALASSVRSNTACCIRVTGNGTINLTADNVTFDALASIHVQYTGTGTLNWTNSNGSDASIGSVTAGGTINFINPATLTINGVINGAEVRLYDDETPSDNNFNTELAGIEVNVGTSFAYAHSGTTNTIAVQMMASGYEEVLVYFTLGATDQALTLFPILETNS